MRVFIATSRGGARELLAEGSGDVMPDVDASLGSRSRSGSGVVEGECVGDFSLARVCERRFGIGVSDARSASNDTRRLGFRRADRKLLLIGRR